MVIGAGPAGMECAITAAKRGHDVTVYERGERIGGNLLGYASRDLARPEDLLSVIRHYEVMAAKRGVKLVLRTEANPKFMRSVLHQYDVCVVAAGARVDLQAYAHIEGRERIVDALEVAAGREAAGKRVVVIGGNKVGLVVAESLGKAGSEVVLLESGKRIAEDVMPTFKWRHTAWVEELGIRVLTATRLLKVTPLGVLVADAKGAQTTLPADTVIAAAPRRSNQELFAEFEWMVDELHGCGDALMPRGLDAAIHEGYRLGVRL